MEMKVAIVIPARLRSTRLPRKLLAPLAGRTVIERTWAQAMKARGADRVVVAVDDEELARAVSAFGGEWLMTRADHGSGTERLAEAADRLDADVIVNVQGDEPEIDPAHIDALIETHLEAGLFAATLACPFPDGLDPADPSAVKAVLGRPLAQAEAFEAIYFTRAPAPWPRDGGRGAYHLHIGVYAYGREALARFAAAPEGRLEAIEKLEQLRILEMGERIAVRRVDRANPGIDTPADLAAAEARLKGDQSVKQFS